MEAITETTNKMDKMAEAAGQADQELDLTWTAAQVAAWWTKWYKTAGHKRLGRILVTKTA